MAVALSVPLTLSSSKGGTDFFSRLLEGTPDCMEVLDASGREFALLRTGQRHF